MIFVNIIAVARIRGKNGGKTDGQKRCENGNDILPFWGSMYKKVRITRNLGRKIGNVETGIRTSRKMAETSKTMIALVVHTLPALPCQLWVHPSVFQLVYADSTTPATQHLYPGALFPRNPHPPPPTLPPPPIRHHRVQLPHHNHVSLPVPNTLGQPPPSTDTPLGPAPAPNPRLPSHAHALPPSLVRPPLRRPKPPNNPHSPHLHPHPAAPLPVRRGARAPGALARRAFLARRASGRLCAQRRGPRQLLCRRRRRRDEPLGCGGRGECWRV